MSSVLVAAASRHGATFEVAERIAQVLRREGLAAHVRQAREVDSLDDYDAVVLGSAVYMGRWLDDARGFAQQHADDLRARPVWLFSSGPIGDPPQPSGDEAVAAGEIVAALEPEEHVVLAGKVDRSVLGLRERIVLKAVNVPDGDFRDWPVIEEWAASIAARVRDLIPA